MPVESTPHERAFMRWPNSLEVYGTPLLSQVQNAIALIANAIARYGPVVMLDRRGT